jgi:hypothetical protein
MASRCRLGCDERGKSSMDLPQRSKKQMRQGQGRQIEQKEAKVAKGDRGRDVDCESRGRAGGTR